MRRSGKCTRRPDQVTLGVGERVGVGEGNAAEEGGVIMKAGLRRSTDTILLASININGFFFCARNDFVSTIVWLLERFSDSILSNEHMRLGI